MIKQYSCNTCDHFGECSDLTYCGGRYWQPKRRDDEEQNEDQDEEGQ